MSFRLVPKSVTLNDLERRNGSHFALFQRIWVASGAQCVKVHVRYLISWWVLVSFSKTAHWCTCIVRATQSNCCGAVEFLLLNHAPNSPELNALITRFRPSYSSVSMSHESIKTEEIKERLVEFWQCTDTAFEWKNAIFVFPRFARYSAEAQVIWGGTLKRLLIAYFISNISAKNIKMHSGASKL